MSVVYIEPAQNSVHNEDIELAGETIISQPCTVWDIILTNDTATAGKVNISNSEGYDSTYRVIKVALAASSTVQLTFPRGRKFSTGLSASANTGSLDISVSYD